MACTPGRGTGTNRAGSISSTDVPPLDRVRGTQPTSSLPAGYALVGFTGPEPGDAPETAVENECPLVANTNPLSALWQHPPRGGGDKSEK